MTTVVDDAEEGNLSHCHSNAQQRLVAPTRRCSEPTYPDTTHAAEWSGLVDEVTGLSAGAARTRFAPVVQLVSSATRARARKCRVGAPRGRPEAARGSIPGAQSADGGSGRAFGRRPRASCAVCRVCSEPAQHEPVQAADKETRTQDVASRWLAEKAGPNTLAPHTSKPSSTPGTLRVAMGVLNIVSPPNGKPN